MTELEHSAMSLLLNAYYCFEDGGEEKTKWLEAVDEWMLSFYVQAQKEEEWYD